MEREEYKCPDCYDTGCRCGGIGLSCHGCCTCPAGDRARENRKKAISEMLALVLHVRGTEPKQS